MWRDLNRERELSDFRCATWSASLGFTVPTKHAGDAANMMHERPTAAPEVMPGHLRKGVADTVPQSEDEPGVPDAGP